MVNLVRAISGRVPIDCVLARAKFEIEISSKDLRGMPISVSGWNCSSDAITASIDSKISPIVSFPLLSKITGGSIEVNAVVGAASEIPLRLSHGIS